MTDRIYQPWKFSYMGELFKDRAVKHADEFAMADVEGRGRPYPETLVPYTGSTVAPLKYS